ncbi:3-oxoadipate enol-lactonase [Noviherbaspirillum sp.]|uniref:3-oxoadipate enol-lactonase n=1 Tax=Noviherbaspirillum sp. TaxID=1926288 RepID=UPI002B468268|nr:3-oxoadipate enol-lactonase [Noviherbaspirillum sp.]HJV80965.1 3-oxoadipate enol-lactonase [Noviherbaspirillum sp.]
MPNIELPHCRIRYRFDGAAANPVLLLCNSLGANLSMWDGVVPHLADDFQVLRYDGQGQGDSSDLRAACTLEDLGRDACALLDALNIKDVHFCGQAMGSLIGIWLALFRRSRLKKLILANTAATIGTRDFWDARIAAVENNGLAPMADAIVGRWFTPDYAAANPTVIERMKDMLLRSTPSSYGRYCAAIRDVDFHGQLDQISTPTLVIGATHDGACPPQESLFVCNHIAGAKYQELPAAHMSSIETPEAFAAALKSFLAAEGDRGDLLSGRGPGQPIIRRKE